MADVDSFEAASTAVPVKVGRLEIVMGVSDDDNDGTFTYDSRYSVDRLAADGTIVGKRSGPDVTPHLTPTERGQIKAILDRLYGKARANP